MREEAPSRLILVCRAFAVLVVLHLIALAPLSSLADEHHPCPDVQEMRNGPDILDYRTSGCVAISGRAALLAVLAGAEVVIALMTVPQGRQAGSAWAGAASGALTLGLTLMSLTTADGPITTSNLILRGWTLAGLVSLGVLAITLIFYGLLLPYRGESASANASSPSR